eukprot:3166404-Amphidinium_carterae.1
MDKAGMAAFTSSQHRGAFAKAAFAHLVPEGLSKAEHIQAALSLQHPFDKVGPLELDVQYVLSKLTALGPSITAWRQH